MNKVCEDTLRGVTTTTTTTSHTVRKKERKKERKTDRHCGLMIGSVSLVRPSDQIITHTNSEQLQQLIIVQRLPYLLKCIEGIVYSHHPPCNPSLSQQLPPDNVFLMYNAINAVNILSSEAYMSAVRVSVV